MVIQRGEPSPTRGSGNQQDAGPYFVGQIIPVVDHHFKIGVRDRKDAADCVPLSDRQRVARRGTCRSYLSATLEVFPSHTVTTCSGVWPATGPMLSAGVAGPVPATSRMRELDCGSIFQCYCVCPGFAYVQYYCA